MKIFTDLGKKYFMFLISEYNYQILEETQIGNQLWHGIITYVSPVWIRDPLKKQTGVQLVLDRGYIRLEIGPLDVDKRHWLDIVDIMRVIKPDVVVYEKTDFKEDATTIIDRQLRKISYLTESYCEPLLRGDFSLSSRIIEAAETWRERKLKEMMRDIENKKLLHSNHR